MREILFRAKRKDNGKWVKGYYMPCPNSLGKPRYYIAPLSQTKWYEIDQNTLCQYTGLSDKNGQKIWENDIIKTNQYGVDNGDGRNFSGFDTFFINFSEGSFCLMNKWRRFNLRPSKYLKVVGNIFDNQELLN